MSLEIMRVAIDGAKEGAAHFVVVSQTENRYASPDLVYLGKHLFQFSHTGEEEAVCGSCPQIGRRRSPGSPSQSLLVPYHPRR